MTNDEVVVGQIYQAKVSGKQVKVKITGETNEIYGGRTHRGWDAINLNTGRTAHFKSGQKLSLVPRYFIDANGETREIERAEAVQTVNECLGVGQWLPNLRQASSAEGILIPGIGRLRIIR